MYLVIKRAQCVCRAQTKMPMMCHVDCNIDKYVRNIKMIDYPFRYLNSCIKVSHFQESVWFCANKHCCIDRNYDVGVTLRQVFDAILSENTTYCESDSVYNSFRRPNDFDISGCSLKDIIENIKLNSDIVILKFEFVYNPLCVNRMLDFVHDTENEYPKCVQTLCMVTNSLHDVEDIKTARSNVVDKIVMGTNCMDILETVEYNVLGHKYIIVCDTATKTSEYTSHQHTQTRCICPYYVIKIESKSRLVPQLQKKLIEGLLYRELALVLPVAKQNKSSAPTIAWKIETTKTTQKILYVKNRQILLNASATKVLLNNEPNVEYQIEEFLKVRKHNNEVFDIVGLSTKNQKQQELIISYNKKTTLVSMNQININFLYVSIQNKLTIKISLHDRVFVTVLSTVGAAGLGTVRRIIHPQTIASYNLHEHFMDLVYLVELDNEKTTQEVVKINIARMMHQTLQFPMEPVHYLRCEIFDIYQCSEYQ